MFTRQDLKRLSDEDIEEYTGYYQEQLALTERRLAALLKTRAVQPRWSAFDPFIGEEVGIDIRIEEQEAVRDEITDYLQLFSRETEHRQGLNQTMRMF